MAFVINQNPAVWWTVSFKTPCEGGAENQQIRIKFKRLKRKEAAKFAANLTAGNRENIDEILAHEKELLEKIVLGWEGIETSDGEPLAFSADNLALLVESCDGMNVASAIFRAYFDFLQVQDQALEKN